MIETSTKLFAVIGQPIGHSLSPQLHHQFIRLFQLDAVYVAFEVHERNMPEAIAGMKALGIRGFNVTTPHKAAAAKLADEASPAVRLLGVANTLKNTEGYVQAFVTDPPGFIESLGDRRARFKNASVLVFGAGGSARSVVYALAELGVQRVIIANRTLERAQELKHLAMTKFGIPRAEAISPSEHDLNGYIGESEILINTTSVGMHPNTDQSILPEGAEIGPNHFLYDLVYNPQETRFLAIGRKKGAATQNGLDMLIFQGLESCRIWHDQDFTLGEKELAHIRKRLVSELTRDG